MTILSPNVVDTTLIQDGQVAGAITPADMRILNDSLAGMINTTQTASYTATLNDRGTMVEFNSATGVTLSIPTNAVTAFDVGTVIGFYQMGAGQLTIAAVTPGTTTVRTSSSLTTRAQFSQGSIRKRATDEWVVSGDMT